MQIQQSVLLTGIAILSLTACNIVPVQSSRPVNDELIVYPSGEDEYHSTTRTTTQTTTTNNNLNRAAVTDLLEKSDYHFRAGSYAKAESVLERALRLEPDSANLWYRLAKIKLAKGNGIEAERMAEKSNALAHNSISQVTANWLLIAEARRLAGDQQGALEAEARAHGAGAR